MSAQVATASTAAARGNQSARGHARGSASGAASFTKTKMCKFQILGGCSKGVECPFAHNPDELKPLPDLQCTKLCKALLRTGVCKSAGCAYAHSKEELRILGGSAFKTKTCRFFQESGKCLLGAKCNFAHSDFEKRDSNHSNQSNQAATPPAVPSPPRNPVASPPRQESQQSERAPLNLVEFVPLPPGLAAPTALSGLCGKDGEELANDSPAYVTIGNRGHVVSQEDGFLRITGVPYASAFGKNVDPGAAGIPAGYPFTLSPLDKPMRPVRTSESTLCSLTDNRVAA